MENGELVRSVRRQSSKSVCASGDWTSSASRKPYTRYSKPPYTYLGLIAATIWTSPSGQLTLNEIVNCLTRAFSFFRLSAYRGWRDSLRHNLSQSPCFVMKPKNPGNPRGKGNYWCVDWDKVPINSFDLQSHADASRTGVYADNLFDEMDVVVRPRQFASSDEVTTAAFNLCSVSDNMKGCVGEGDSGPTTKTESPCNSRRRETSSAPQPPSSTINAEWTYGNVPSTDIPRTIAQGTDAPHTSVRCTNALGTDGMGTSTRAENSPSICAKTVNIVPDCFSAHAQLKKHTIHCNTSDSNEECSPNRDPFLQSSTDSPSQTVHGFSDIVPVTKMTSSTDVTVTLTLSESGCDFKRETSSPWYEGYTEFDEMHPSPLSEFVDVILKHAHPIGSPC